MYIVSMHFKNNSRYGPSSHLIVTNLPTTPSALLFDWQTTHYNFGVMYLCVFIIIQFERFKFTSNVTLQIGEKEGWAILSTFCKTQG